MARPTPRTERILALLRDGPRQAKELAADVGIDASAVRRRLERLRADGLVAREDVVEGVGRPKTRYALTREGREAFPRDYALLLRAVLAKVEARQGRDEVLRTLESVAGDLGASAAAAGDRDAQLQTLLALYNGLGFEARFVREGRDLAFVQRNCIFLKAAERDPDALCRCLDEGILRAGLPGVEVDLQQCMATGDPQCRHRLRWRATQGRPRGGGSRNLKSGDRLPS